MREFSTGDQNLDLQIDALKGAGVKERHIYQETMSGTKADRPQLEAILLFLSQLIRDQFDPQLYFESMSALPPKALVIGLRPSQMSSSL